MLRIYTFASFLLAVFANIATAATPLTLVRDGEPQALIVVASDRQWETQSHTILVEAHASRCLQANILQMSGATLPIVSDKKLGDVTVNAGRLIAADPAIADKTLILLGDTALTRQLGVNTDDLTPGGLRVRTFDNALVLIGHPAISHPNEDGGGLRAAVVQLLESLGCRYLWPGESGKVVPQLATITLAPMDVTFNPPIQQRKFRWRTVTGRTREGIKALGLDAEAFKLGPAMATRASELVPPARYQNASDFSWLQWQRTGGDVDLDGGHAFGNAWDKWGKDHPEWFALQADGTRDQSNAGQRSRLCVSNLGLIDAIAAEIIAEADAKPTKISFSLAPNDGGYSSFCTCSHCEALDAPDGPRVKMLAFDKVGHGNRKAIDHAALTDRYVWFWNQIANRVVAKHPGALLVIDAYSHYATAPRRETLHPNLVVRYVPSTAAEWDGWQAAGATRIYWRPNILHNGTKQGELNVYARSLTDTARTLAADGLLAVDMDSITGSWSTVGMNYYAAARIAWNPSLTYDQILDDFCHSGFGSAAEAVKAYYLAAEASRDAHGLYNMPLADIAKLRDLLRHAENAAGTDDAVRRRIAMLRLGLNFTDVRQRIKALLAIAEADGDYDRAQADRLLDLHYLMLRDLALHHPLAIDAGLITRYSAGFRAWRALGAHKRRPNDALLNAAAAKPCMTGREDSMEQLYAAFGLDDAAHEGQAVETDGSATVMEADEEGGVRELPGL